MWRYPSEIPLFSLISIAGIQFHEIERSSHSGICFTFGRYYDIFWGKCKKGDHAFFLLERTERVFY